MKKSTLQFNVRPDMSWHPKPFPRRRTLTVLRPELGWSRRKRVEKRAQKGHLFSLSPLIGPPCFCAHTHTHTHTHTHVIGWYRSMLHFCHISPSFSALRLSLDYLGCRCCCSCCCCCWGRCLRMSEQLSCSCVVVPLARKKVYVTTSARVRWLWYTLATFCNVWCHR